VAEHIIEKALVYATWLSFIVLILAVAWRVAG